ncbi:MAG: hypothetical protein REI96_17790 [Flavobacterium nitrogenifigens]|uniref:hypothetical protein n=1 Tax=Flavobacterium nitrogenifigens TaxID=1617283 RepID=UPI00280921A7|nr:hypothetical protein [Flavobacterium nitrogenifigens]MDQ8014304.1 hypothetical protein [Flavobacterium nitrogenifigens]
MMKNSGKYIGVNSKERNATVSCNEDRIAIESANIASSKAVRISKALGITIKVIRNHQIIEINADGTKNVLRKISKPSIDLSSLRKGMILERK